MARAFVTGQPLATNPDVPRFASQKTLWLTQAFSSCSLLQTDAWRKQQEFMNSRADK